MNIYIIIKIKYNHSKDLYVVISQGINRTQRDRRDRRDRRSVSAMLRLDRHDRREAPIVSSTEKRPPFQQRARTQCNATTCK